MGKIVKKHPMRVMIVRQMSQCKVLRMYLQSIWKWKVFRIAAQHIAYLFIKVGMEWYRREK